MRKTAFYRWGIMVVLCVIVLGVFDHAQASGDFQIQPTLVSKNASGTGAGNNASYASLISADGNRVIFESDATDLTSVPITTDHRHLFAYDHSLGAVTLIDKNASSTGSATEIIDHYVLSQDGGSLVLDYNGSDLTNDPDSNNASDIFLYDVDTDTMTLITTNAVGTSAANGGSVNASISADGNLIAFGSAATDLTANPDTNNAADVYLYDVSADAMTLISTALGSSSGGNAHSGSPHISEDGSTIIFVSLATDLTADVDTNALPDVFSYDIASGTTTLITKNFLGTNTPNGNSWIADVSADGQFVVIRTQATDLVDGGEAGFYLYNALDGSMKQIAATIPYSNSERAFISADGSQMAFENSGSVFRYDVQSDTTQLVTKDLQGTPVSAYFGYINFPASPISADGNSIIFTSNATNLTDDPVTGGNGDAYLYDTLTDTITLVSQNRYGTGSGVAPSSAEAISADGSTIVIDSMSIGLTDDNTTGGTNAYRLEFVMPLNKPTNVSAVPVSNGQIDLTWTDNSPDETSFVIKRSLNGYSWTQIGTTSADDTTFSDTGLTCGTTYGYMVRAYRSTDDVYSYASMTVIATPLCGPNTPTDLSATPISQTQIDLSWADTASDETSFHIERSPNGLDGWTQIGTTSADDTTYSDTSAACNTTYHYRVRAHRSGDDTYSYFTNMVEVSTWTCGVFADVPVEGKAWMQEWIEVFYAAGITTGCGTAPSGQPIYCPETSTTRAEMAVFIIRALNYGNLPYTPTDPDDSFDDVPVLGKEWMQAWIEEFYDLGITTGCAANPLRYCPERPVTRAEMAVFLLRALEGGSYQPPAASHYFSDVPVDGKAWMEAWIDEFYRRGITTGCAVEPLRFCPDREVTRAEMAVFIIRAFESIPNP